jgi:hypothetical protein
VLTIVGAVSPDPMIARMRGSDGMMCDYLLDAGRVKRMHIGQGSDRTRIEAVPLGTVAPGDS